MIDYTAVKGVHVGAVVLSGALFALRGAWRFLVPEGPLPRAARIVPILVDTVLLVSALALASFWLREKLPLAWIGVKVVVLIAYIALGALALRSGLRPLPRAAAFAAAAAAFGYIVSVALTKSTASPLGWLP